MMQYAAPQIAAKPDNTLHQRLWRTKVYAVLAKIITANPTTRVRVL